ncbi:MAG: biotin--[acetyl-CoA-carboxylase] ligase [Acidobacteria bacterium]|nr:biotin--[acetyl-CoA-carboxylase] ligase [Acidobacteriota bacterium]
MRALLEGRGLAWPAPIEHFAVVGSTNDVAKERARAGAAEWSVVLADRQTAGRGRHGHVWASPAGNLCLSILLRPVWTPERTMLLPLAAGVAASEALGEFGVEVRLKWPNDLLAGERKAGGILAEALSGAAGLEAVVLGIGVNVAVDPAVLPGDLRATTTSLRVETGRDVAVADVAAAVLARLAVWYDALASLGAPALLDAWRARAVPWWGHPVEVRYGDRVIRGIARGVDERGALLLEEEGGRVTAVLSGEVLELRLR